MANIALKEQTTAAEKQKTSWNYWSSLRESLSFYIQNGLNCSELLNELCAAKQAITQKNGSSKKAKKLWGTYVEKATKGIETIEYVEKLLATFVENDFKVPTTEMVNSVSDQDDVIKESKITPKEMKPIAVEINKDLSSDWNYWESVRKVRKLYLKWSSVSSEMLRELYIAKQAITKGGTRKSGLPKKGEMSWNRYVEEAFGGMVGKRTIDSHLLAYENNGFEKPEKLTVNAISDHTKVIIKSAAKEADGRVKVEIFLPEFNTTYIQYFNA